MDPVLYKFMVGDYCSASLGDVVPYKYSPLLIGPHAASQKLSNSSRIADVLAQHT